MVINKSKIIETNIKTELYQKTTSSDELVNSSMIIEYDDYIIHRNIVNNKVFCKLVIKNHVEITDYFIEPINKRFLFDKYAQVVMQDKVWVEPMEDMGSISFNHLIDDSTQEMFGFNGWHEGQSDIFNWSAGVSSSPSYISSYNLPKLNTVGLSFTYTPGTLPEPDGFIRVVILEGTLI